MNDAAKEFFDSLPSDAESETEFDIFKEQEEPEKVAPAEQVEETETAEEPKLSRKERRADKQREYYEAQLQEEREARIRLEEQVKALAPKAPEVDADIQMLMTGAESPEEATRAFQNLLKKAREEAAEEALQRLREARASEEEGVDRIHAQIESSIEAIEDRYGVDLTDDSAKRNAFLDFVESIAPPDSDALPNMETAWKLFSATQKASTSNVERKTQIASRGLVRSGNAKPEAKDVQPMSFEGLNRAWDKIVNRS